MTMTMTNTFTQTKAKDNNHSTVFSSRPWVYDSRQFVVQNMVSKIIQNAI